MTAPIETLTEWHPSGEGVCTGCGSPCVDDLCDVCFDARWTRVNEPRVCACGNPVDTLLAVRCQDCRDGIGRIDEFLRRAA